ncbi:hypothetical protein C1O63_1552 [Dehalococcoides mccartyi]|nr:hypothetical protein C1O63_1552 [Dehalococcoides mccartyi]
MHIPFFIFSLLMADLYQAPIFTAKLSLLKRRWSYLFGA